MQANIKQLQVERETMRAKGQHAARKVEGARRDVQIATAEFEVQSRSSKQAVSDAMKQCDRIETERLENTRFLAAGGCTL